MNIINLFRSLTAGIGRHRVASVTAILGILVPSAVLGVTLAAPATSGGSPMAGLSASDASAVALSVARAAGDEAPTELQSVEATVGSGAVTVGPGTELPDSPAVSQWASEPAYVEVIRGHFTPDVPRPKGAPAPTGTVLSLVVGAYTGSVAFTALNDNGPLPSALAKLGTVARTIEPR